MYSQYSVPIVNTLIPPKSKVMAVKFLTISMTFLCEVVKYIMLPSKCLFVVNICNYTFNMYQLYYIYSFQKTGTRIIIIDLLSQKVVNLIELVFKFTYNFVLNSLLVVVPSLYFSLVEMNVQSS